jgi:hypothetical protein
MTYELQGIRQWLTRLGEWAAHPGAYGIIVVYTVLWFVFDRTSLDWHWRCHLRCLIHDATHTAH